MSWDTKIRKWAVTHGMGATALGVVESAKRQTALLHVAKWQRDQLRTDEAVERVAIELISQRGYYTGEGWPTNQDLSGGPTSDRDVEFKHAWMDNAKEVIDALLGETS